LSEQGPPPVPGARSEEERQRARLAREARRAGRDGDGDGDGLFVDDARPVVPREPRRPRRSGTPNVAARRVVALILLALIAAAAWFLISLFQPFKGHGSGNVSVSIPKGDSVSQIGDLLHKRGVVSSSFFFELRARLGGHSGDLKPGLYQLKKDMSYSAALTALTKGVAPNVVSVVIPEGRSRREIAPLTKGLKGSYLAATVRSSSLNPTRYGAKHARNLEGFLFPASYQLKKGASVHTLVNEQLQAFRQNFGKVSLTYARKKNLTRYDVLTIASMVEREAQVAKERPLIAAVIYNRLHDHMPLGIDATIRYALNDWTKPLRQSQLASPSPYNTRNHVGLPPGPIGNPGLASIQAAAHPAKSGFLFYVVKPYTCGQHSFSRTQAQFDRDVARYNAARVKNHGRAPTKC
jgi:uncharacterized YceG family protein